LKRNVVPPRNSALNECRAFLGERDKDLPIPTTVEDENPVTKVVHVLGGIDAFTAADLERALRRELVDRPVRLIVDLSLVGLLGSTGLVILRRMQDDCLLQGVELALTCDGRKDVLEQLKIIGLERLFLAEI
jgi:anti-sigma B factor antagonist